MPRVSQIVVAAVTAVPSGVTRRGHLRRETCEKLTFFEILSMAPALLCTMIVRIQLTFTESPDPLEELLGGRLSLTEVLEGRQEFLEELMSRLAAITRPFDGDQTLPLNRAQPDYSEGDSQ
ncbi:MAG: hypothetical protein M3167_05070 [Acidobacteriota bacterium]|nr:hypothetical protein [Acidobacteriota bacterium]